MNDYEYIPWLDAPYQENPIADYAKKGFSTPGPLPELSIPQFEGGPITDPAIIKYLKEKGYTPEQIYYFQAAKQQTGQSPQATAPAAPQQTRRTVPKTPGLGDTTGGAYRMGEDAAASAATGGLYGVGKKVIDKVAPGVGERVNDIRNVTDYVNPNIAPAKIAFKLADKLNLFGSSKSEDQQRRDQVRKAMVQHKMFGDDPNDYTLENPDGTSFDVGKDGGARYQGRRMFDIDTSDKAPAAQAGAIGAVNPLAYLITGGDKQLATDFAGYFTNTIMQGKGATDPTTLKLNALDKYKKAGFDTPEKAHAGIDELVKAGKIDPKTALAFHNGINSVYGVPAAPARNPGVNPNASANNLARRRAAGDNKRRRTQAQSYAPQVFAPNVLSPNSTASGYDSFGQGIANVYRQNQEGLI